MILPDKKLILPRRKVLTGIAALAGARVIEPALARPIHGGSANTSPTPPPWPAANGFPTLTRSSNFDSLSDFDLTNSQAPGFKFYMNPAWPNAPFATYWEGSSPVTPASDLTLTGAGITLAPASNAGQAGNYLTSATPRIGSVTTPTAYDGFTYTNGGYVEYLCKFAPASAGVPCPALWSVSIESMIGSSITDSIELDYPEDGNPGIHFFVFDWTSYSPNVNTNQGSFNAFPSVDFTQYNRWGLGWKTQAQNGGGLGILDLVCNDSVVYTLNYSSTGGSPTGVYSVIEAQHQCLLLGASTTEALYLGKGTTSRPGHTVWQT